MVGTLRSLLSVLLEPFPRVVLSTPSRVSVFLRKGLPLENYPLQINGFPWVVFVSRIKSTVKALQLRAFHLPEQHFQNLTHGNNKNINFINSHHSFASKYFTHFQFGSLLNSIKIWNLLPQHTTNKGMNRNKLQASVGTGGFRSPCRLVFRACN